MNATDQINTVVRLLAISRSIKARVEVLKNYDSELLRKVLRATYDPYIRYGVKPNRMTGAGTMEIDDDEVWNLLSNLQKSTASSASKSEQIESVARRMTQGGADLLHSIITKSLTAGVSDSTVNKAFPGLIPSFSVQLAQKFTERKHIGYPTYAEVKYDGMRSIGIVYPTGEVSVVTRTGREVPAARYFHTEIKVIADQHRQWCKDNSVEYNGTVLDGEIVSSTFADTMSIYRSDAEAESGEYFVFDVLPMEALSDPSYVSPTFSVRRAILQEVFKDSGTTKVLPSTSYLVGSSKELWHMYERVRSAGQEGLIVKHPTSKWVPKRSNDWLKMKAEETDDLIVIGAFEGEGEKRGTLGGLIVDRKGVQVRVGSGFTAEMSDRLWHAFNRDLNRSENGDEMNYELIGFPAEVQYQEVTKDGSLRHPVFVRLRKDKFEASF